MTNYRDNYACVGCSAIGVKLWRDYQTSADACELRCAECATRLEVARNKNSDRSPLCEDGVFTFRDGDQIGGLVPAVPTDDGSTFWGYTSISPGGVAWWHDLPTYRDETRERRCLENLLKRAELGQACWPERLARGRCDIETLARQLNARPPEAPIATLTRAGRGDGSVVALRVALLATYCSSDALYQEWITIAALKRDLQWKVERLVYAFTQPSTLTIWGTVTKPIGGGMVLRYGAELPRAVTRGARIAVVPGGEAHLICEVDSYQESALVMDDDRNGDALISRLIAAGIIVPENEPNVAKIEGDES